MSTSVHGKRFGELCHEVARDKTRLAIGAIGNGDKPEQETRVRSMIALLTAASLVALGFISRASAADTLAPLASPWDKPIALDTSFAGHCPVLPPLPQSLILTGYYTDKNHSVVDPERMQRYKHATKTLYGAARAITKRADQYQQTGQAFSAACALKDLTVFVGSKSLTNAMTGNQARYVQGWMLGALSIAWLKIRTAPEITPASQKLITDWLASVAVQNMHYYDQRPKAQDARNNHRYWAGLAVTAAGIAANRRDLFDWGVESSRIGIRQITADGTLPLEMDRRARALHYHLFAAAPLVINAELAAENGVDLYRENDQAIARLVHRTVAGISNPAPFAQKAGVPQEPIALTASTLGWLIPFERRFPDPTLKAIADRIPRKPVLYLGGLPPG
jgi:poly(beta-D-mannuronate) lyase